VASPDLARYAENLRRAGCPEQTIKDILLAEVNRQYAAREAALKVRPDDIAPWEAASGYDRRGGETDTARAQRAVDALDGGLQAVDELQRLGEDDAVERGLGERFGPLEVGDDRRTGIAGVDVEHLGGLDGGPEPHRVGVVEHLEHATPDRTGLPRD